MPQLTSTTNRQGLLGQGPNFPHGPYLHTGAPVNPWNGSRRVQAAPSAPPTHLELFAGWLYDPASGRFWAGEAR